MVAVRWSLALAVGGFLIFFGMMKFTGAAHIFPYIEYRATAAGIPFAQYAYPVGNFAIGAIEVITGLLLIAPTSRRAGALLAVLPFLGAVLFHLSPALGVITPSSFADPKPLDALADGGPFTAADFSGETSMLFYMAVGGLVASIFNLIVQRNT